MAAIELDGLTKDYGDVLAVDDLGFAVESGEIFGFLGPNGAGKSTTIRTLLGFLHPTSGSARVLDAPISDRAALREARRRIGYLADDPGFDEDVTGRRILEFHGSVKGDERSDELLELFDPPIDRPVRDYSRGNVQKLGLVTTFMHEPDLAILDEPTSGLDPLLQQRFAEFLRAERRRGVTVFFSSHVLSEVRRLCDRVAIVREGRLVTVGPIDSLLARSGKAVRLATREPVPRDRLDLDGVHDLQATDHQTTDVDAGDPGTSPATFTEATFTYTGDVGELLERLAAMPLADCSIEEAPLEDVFARFYGETDGAEPATALEAEAGGVDEDA